MDNLHIRYVQTTSVFPAADRKLRVHNDRQAVRNIWLLFASILAFLTLVNIFRKLSARWCKPRPSSPVDSSKDVEKSDRVTPEGEPSSGISRLFYATATSFRIAFFRWPVWIGPGAFSSVSELTFIFLYIASNLLWLFIDTRHFNVDFYKTRAGMLASAQLPLVVTLANKNNIISWMTGISHERLHGLHNAAGHTMFLLLWIHTIGRAVTPFSPKDSFDDPFMQAGVAGIAALSAGVFLSLKIIREALFEFFFVSHIILMLIFLIGGYIHLHGLGYGSYIWPAFLMWGLDRVFRAIRLLWNNVYQVEETARSQATVELLTEDTIRLTFRRKFHWRPGQHAYISIPKISTLPFETHPFTIASIPNKLDGTKRGDKEVVFLIRAKSGLTRRLKDFALNKGSNSVAAYVDGPYGSPPNLHQYSTCVLVAGGSGVSYTLPLLLDLIQQSAIGGSSEVRRVLFVWVVRGDGHLPWITEDLSKALSLVRHPLDVEARVYITYPNATTGILPAESSNSISKSEKEQVFAEPESTGIALRIHHGRPDITAVLHEEISASLGHVFVDVAGPCGLTASIRKALTTGAAGPGAVLKGKQPVTLHVETKGMVRA